MNKESYFVESKLIYEDTSHLKTDLIRLYYREEVESDIAKVIFKNKEKIIKILLEDLNKIIRALELYLVLIEADLDISSDEFKKLELIQSLNVDAILSFNYTHTYSKLYDLEKRIQYDYIHGSISKERSINLNNMVLGIDEYLLNEDKDKKLDFVEFKKYFQRILKKTGCTYKKWIEGYMSFDNHDKVLLNNIYIFGYSLDITDKDILKELFELKNTIVTIFYYNIDDYKQKIINVIKIIGQDKLIQKVHGENPTIVFHNQNDGYVQVKEIDNQLIYE